MGGLHNAWLDEYQRRWDEEHDAWAAQIEQMAAEGAFGGQTLVEHPDIEGIWRLDRHGRAERVD